MHAGRCAQAKRRARAVTINTDELSDDEEYDKVPVPTVLPTAARLWLPAYYVLLMPHDFAAKGPGCGTTARGQEEEEGVDRRARDKGWCAPADRLRSASARNLTFRHVIPLVCSSCVPHCQQDGRFLIAKYMRETALYLVFLVAFTYTQLIGTCASRCACAPDVCVSRSLEPNL